MATLAQLQKALVNADKAGDMDGARKLAVVIKMERARLGDTLMIPGTDDSGDAPGTVPEQKSAPLSVSDALGPVDAGLSIGSSLVAPVIGAVAGVGHGLIDLATGAAANHGEDRAAGTADKVTQALTYEPRTALGKDIVGTFGELAEPLSQLDPMLAPQLGGIGEAASVPVMRAVATERVAAPMQRVASTIKTAAADLAEQVKAKITPGVTERALTPGTGKNAGAAAIDVASMRRANAEELGFTGDRGLTEGQVTRDFEQQRFERETAKQGAVGQPIRERMENQNLHLQQKLDEFIDGTGAEITETRGVGELVDKSLTTRRTRDKTKVRALYTEARKSDEAQLKAPADTKVVGQGADGADISQSPVDYLNSRPTKVETSKAVDDARANGLHLKVLVKNEDGTYSANPNATVGQMEDWRREISQSLSKTASDTEIRDVTILKKLIDGVTEPLAGPKYKQARAARATMAADYENSHLVKQLLGTKPGSSDRAVSFEQVAGKVLSPDTSVDQLTHMERLLKTEGETGQQAWKEIQGHTLRHIRDEALKGVSRDSAGNQIVSASGLDRAVTALDKTGKLDVILGKQRANKVRLINDVAKDIFTAVPGAVNTSNTATVLAGLLDVAVSGMSGVPLPIATIVKQATSRIKDAKLRVRVKQALGE